MNFPVSLLAFGAAVMDVLAAGAELARLGTNSTLVVGGCHGGCHDGVEESMSLNEQ